MHSSVGGLLARLKTDRVPSRHAQAKRVLSRLENCNATTGGGGGGGGQEVRNREVCHVIGVLSICIKMHM